MKRICYLFSLLTILASMSVSAVERIGPELSEILDRGRASNTDAIVLHQEKDIQLDTNGNTLTTVYRAIKINSRDAARDFSQISISFNSHFEDLKLDFARVITADGSVMELDNDAVQVQTNRQSDFYEDGRQLVFSLPAIEKGAIIEYQATYDPLEPILANELIGSSFFHSPKWITSEKGVRIDPVYESIIRVTIPDTKSLIYQIKQKGITHEKKQKNGEIIHQWVARKLPAVEIESAMPTLSEIAPFIEFSTLTSWQGIDRWASDMIKPTFQVSNEIADVVQRIADRNLERTDKIFEVYQYLQQNVRYVFAHVDRGGYLPHKASKVLSSRYGDCKDQTVLAVTMLRELGIEAYPSLISSNNTLEASPEIPGLPFDHMITYIPGKSRLDDIWFDTAGEQVLFPGYSSMIEDRNTLVIDGRGGRFLTTPKYKDDDNAAVIDIVFDPIQDKNVSGTITFRYSGGMENYYRSWWINTDDRKLAVTQMIKELYPIIELQSVTASDPHDLKKPFSFTAKFIVEEDWSGKSSLSYSASTTQLIRLFTGLGRIVKPEERQHEFVIEKTTNLKLNLLVKEPRSGFKPILINPGLNQNNQFYRLEQHSKKLGNDYEISISLRFNKGRISKDNYAEFYSDVQRLIADKPWLILYESSRSNVAKQRLDDNQSVAMPESAESLLNAIKQSLDIGEYAEALNKAEKYTQLKPNAGEGYYLLGLAQGYMDKFDEADFSFNKAKQLGYNF